MNAATHPCPLAWPVARAPGKVFLAGEYGVLAGGTALVMAVDRYATVAGRRDAPGSDDEASVFASLCRAASGLGASAPLPDGLPRIDTSAHHDGEAKLGLGSSAAWVAALAGSVFAAAGLDLDDPETRKALLHAARDAHRLGRGGSGADVATSVLGGVVRFVDRDTGDAGDTDEASAETITAERVSLPPEHLPLVVHGGAPVSTASAIAHFDGPAGRPVLEAAAAAGDALARALTGGGDVVPCVHAAAAVLADIASRAGLEGGTEALATARTVAHRFGGEVKPSGAGAGDLVLVFVPGVPCEDRPKVAAALRDTGLDVLDLGLDQRGLHLMETEER